MNVSLIIPAYNEEKRLGSFLQSVLNYQAIQPQLISEVLVVDDGSSDATAAVAESFAKQAPFFKTLRHEKNQGKGAAVRTGVLAAQGTYVVFMDADGATPIEELPKMVEALQEAPVGVGNRWMQGAQTERHSPLRQLAGWTYRTYMRLFGLGSIDTMCGFKGYRRATAAALYRPLQENRWLFDTEIAYRAHQQGLAVKNFPIRWESKEGSKLSTGTLLKSAFQIWPLIRRLNKEIKS